jgi:tetratricopeptide (TPR) repeat protein
MTDSSNTTPPSPPFTPRSHGLIGRKHFLDAIHAAIADQTGRSYVFYFVGPGGVGKTRLLEEATAVSQAASSIGWRTTGIVDLYHADYHSPEGLRDAVADGLDPEHQYFQRYRTLRQDLAQKRSYGVTGSELEKARAELERVFQHEYTLLAGQKRLVLCFDTMELVQYESDVVQEICQVQDVDMEIKHWLLKQVSHFPNTVTLFAGRPRLRLQADFEREFTAAGCDFRLFELAGFTASETRAYLDSQREQRSALADMLTPEIEQRIVQWVPIRPIHLTLLLDLSIDGEGLSEIFPVFENGSDTADSVQQVDDEIVSKWLFERLLDPGLPFSQMIYFLLHARKGLDANLLRALVGSDWSEKEIQQSLNHMCSLAFVKTRPGNDRLFLHDEIYDLCDMYFKDDPRYRDSYESIAQYYRQRLEHTTSPREREDLMVEQLYYEFQINARVAYYRYYIHWDEDAIRSNETEFDMRLRDETLRFLDRYTSLDSPFYTQRVAERLDRAAIDRDSAVRWVDRYHARGDYAKACQVAENILHYWKDVNDPLYQADLRMVYATSLTFTTASKQDVERFLEEAVVLLEGARQVEDVQVNRHARISGRTHNNLGYLYRIQGHYGRALAEYKLALPFFKQANIQDELASAHNNLAFLQAQLARIPLALHQVDQALAIRKRISTQYGGRTGRLALSYNTRGLIHTFQEHPIWGERDCRTALKISEEAKENRGIGLSCIGIGFALRKRGDQWKLGVYSDEEAEEHFQNAVESFERAIDIFSHQVNEPIRLWEAYNELGSLYCDWGWLRCQQPDRVQAALEQYEHAIRYQRLALGIAEKNDLHFQIADSYDDMAQAYSDQSFLLASLKRTQEAQESRKRAEDYLENVLAMVPSNFLLVPGDGIPDPPVAGEAYWLALGKVYYWRGTWAFRDVETGLATIQDQEAYVQHATYQFVISAIYFQRFWPESFALEQTLDRFGRFLANQSIHIVTTEWAREQVRAVSKQYNIDLDVVEEAIGDALGL